ncbi:MAG TPA: ABA4-like family protein [Stackebrandtia sp.]|uniref:ABA4-like family protein n=1 Tax=Stackebrandtia sp. TaxID=2023065 RepID=UPI002D4AB9A0|nr:ABA4-like family protein [Stackebrandtia sp.]HZE37276.1 ABA4-like family protein [Stackebrandtia sp.]
MNALAMNLLTYVAGPFWLLMIALPTWRWTRRIIASPLIAVPAALIYAALIVPILGTVLPAVTQPSLDGVAHLLGTPAGAALGWAHFIAFDLFMGRWEYLDARRRGVHPLAMAPILILTILLAPLGYLLYLCVRALPVWTPREAAPQPAA